MLMVSQVCREWEAAALRVNKDVRLARIRIGVVLGKEGGALGTFNHLFFLVNFTLLILPYFPFHPLIYTFKCLQTMSNTETNWRQLK